MTIETVYQSKNYKPGDGERFVRAQRFEGTYRWCIRVGQYDLAQGTCHAEDLPADVRAAADKSCGVAFSYVAWLL